jgi:hypothetical protein
MMDSIAKRLGDPSLEAARAAIDSAARAAGQGDGSTCPVTAATRSVKQAWAAFRSGVVEFVAIGGPYSPRHDDFWTAVDRAFYETMSSNQPGTD